MPTGKVDTWSRAAWELSARQHGVVLRSQLEELGMGPEAIRHRLSRGRLHRLMAGVYAVGRPEVSERGRWMAAVLACQPDSLLSHRSAAALLGICKPHRGPVEVVIPPHLVKRRAGIRAHGRARPAGRLDSAAPASPHLPSRELVIDEIPVTGPAVVLVDLATCLPTGQLEAAINEADHLDRIDPEALRIEADLLSPRRGCRRLRQLLDAEALSLTTMALERLFRPLAVEAGLPSPETQTQIGSSRVDFFWRDLGLVVEADSLRYHRTAFKQGRDRKRDNAQSNLGLTTLRFTHGQVRHEPDYVQAELRTAARRLSSNRGKLGL